MSPLCIKKKELTVTIMEPVRIEHPIPPTFDAESRILILGSFPSVRSREMGYYYGHPQNRFWRVMAALFSESVPETAAARRAFLLRNHVAAWDVIASCTITGSSDSSIRDVVPNDLRPILAGSRVEKIFCNGTTSYTLYHRHTEPLLGIPAVKLPSTSPANAAWSLDKLTEAWRRILS